MTDKDDFDLDSNGINIPDAPSPTPKQAENLPDWAKITSSIVENTEDAGEIFDKRPIGKEYSPPKKGFGTPLDEIADEDLFMEEDSRPAPVEKIEEEVFEEEIYVAPQNRQPASRTVPDFEEENDEENDEDFEEEVNKKSLFKKVPKAAVKQPRSVKSVKSVKKAISSGSMKKDSEILAPRGRMAGNRWKLIALRTSVWGTLGFIMFIGILTLFGPKGPSISALTQQVLTNINRNNFPMESGEHIASRFAKEYLTLNVATANTRTEILRSYVIGSDSSKSRITSFSSERPLRVIGEPILAKPAELISDFHVVYTFAVQVFQPAIVETEDAPAQPATDPEWIYLAVPVAADKDGAIGISGAPAFVPQPKIASVYEDISFPADTKIRSEAQPQIELFLSHWANSDSVALKPYLIDDLSTSVASAGLGGTVDFVRLGKLSIEAFPSGYVEDPEVVPTCSAPNYAYPCRKAYVETVWKYGTFEIANNYRMIVLFDGQNWRVVDIRGAHFGPLGG